MTTEATDVPSKETTPPRSAPIDATPGALRGETWLTLHTRHAQRLFMGRSASADQHYVIGITRFGSLLSQLLVCVQAGDPYADWWLVKVEDALEVAAQEIAHLRSTIDQKLASTPTIDVSLAASLRPIRVPLQFRNPYAYSAARLLADFDTLARGVLTVRHVGLMDREESQRYLLLAARSLRRALGTAHGYLYTGIKRQDILDNNAKAQHVRERLGELPHEIQNDIKRARHAPVRSNAPDSAKHVSMLQAWRKQPVKSALHENLIDTTD
jgi:integrating conjugative element protein (TIGR03761 family)